MLSTERGIIMNNTIKNFNLIKDKIIARYVDARKIDFNSKTRLVAPVQNTSIGIEAIIDFSEDCRDRDDEYIFSSIPEKALLSWEITKEDLLSHAIQNTEKNRKPFVKRLSDVLQIQTETDNVDFVIVSNETLMYGAIMISFPTVQELVLKELKDDFYILPSSVHECLCVSRSVFDKEELLMIVEDVNSSGTIRESDFLANDIYIIRNGKLCRAGDVL